MVGEIDSEKGLKIETLKKLCEVSDSKKDECHKLCEQVIMQEITMKEFAVQLIPLLEEPKAKEIAERVTGETAEADAVEEVEEKKAE